MRLTLHRHARRRAIAAAGVTIVGAALAIAATGNAFAATSCKVVYTVQSAWGGGFVASVAVTNNGDPTTSWNLEYDFPDAAQKIQNLWSGSVTQTGKSVSVRSMEWNGKLATGGTADFGFVGSFGSANPVPTEFKVNGKSCSDVVDPPVAAPTVQITSPAANTSFVAPADIEIMASASADKTRTVSKVEFYHDNLLLNTDLVSPYTYKWTGVPAQTAPYKLQAIAYDNTGAKSAVAEVPVLVEPTSAPTVLAGPGALTVEPGKSKTFDVTLSKAPAADTTVTVSRTAGATTLTATPPSLKFTTTNWKVAQPVTVKAADTAKKGDTATFTSTSADLGSASVVATVDVPGPGDSRFMELYNELKNPANGYFSPEGVPYHSIETLIAEAPDHGHETTSEAYSYWLWLEAHYGRVKGDWKPFNDAWANMEKYIIPGKTDQPTNSFYKADSPATYAPEAALPSDFPVTLDSGVKAGSDPLAAELKSTYASDDMYSMHWLLDVDNVYGYGKCGDGTTKPAYINTFQRGAQESVFETVPHPSCETFKHGGKNGFLDLFIKDSTYAKQWRFTAAPDADARAVQVAYWALEWAKEQGKSADISATVAKAAKMGDYLRYAMYDKYFKNPGCTSTSCAAGTGKSSSNYLLNWYFAWGGATDVNAGWAWRIGSSHNHSGYQNPVAAWALSNVPDLTPKSATAKADWQKSFDRQMEFYTWLQSADGAIAGGATNSWEGTYSKPPAGTPTFYDLAYDEKPVYHDPASNTWFGFQAWTMGRISEMYNITGDLKAKALLDKWVPWAMKHTTIGADGEFKIPSSMKWSGAPETWTPASPKANTGLKVEVVETGQDIGVAGSYVKVLAQYAAKSGNAAAKKMAKDLLDAIWAHRDEQGVSTPDKRGDYKRMDDVYDASTGQGLYIPPGYTGKMANGDEIKAGKSFLDIRSFYKNDPDWPKVDAYLKGGAKEGTEPVFNYHRFWAQVDVATGYAEYDRLFPTG